MSSRDFLVEIGTEELPPKSLRSLELSFLAGVKKYLVEAKLSHGEAYSYATPRRLAVKILGLSERQPDEQVEKLGPSLRAGFDAKGHPTAAAEGFARGLGVSVAQLSTAGDGDKQRLVYHQTKIGLEAQELLPEIVKRSLSELPVAKRMRWGSSRDEFVRPVRSVVLLFGGEIIPAEIYGVKSGRRSAGHRFHAPQGIEVGSPAEYPECLRSVYVVADFLERQGMIRSAVEKAASALNGRVISDQDFLDEITSLTEWPIALVGGFADHFLSVPAEALISSMRGHQRYFPVVDQTTGKLLPQFILIAGLDSTNSSKVIEGNQKVITPRLSDASFFYQQDCKRRLESRRERLSTVTFQAGLGNLLDKSNRVAAIASLLAESCGESLVDVQRAAELCKCDLMTEMVSEFAELQGIMGEYYARHDGEAESVAIALREQYLPRFAGDELPKTRIGLILGVADRIDTLVGITGLGQLPTGSKDPFALRRNSISILRLVIEGKLELDLKEVLTAAYQNFDHLPAGEKTILDALHYLEQRYYAWYEEQGVNPKLVDAVLARKITNPVDFDLRVKVLQEFVKLPAGQSLSAAHKRVGNILAKRSAEELRENRLDPELFQVEIERELFGELARRRELVKPYLNSRDYYQVLSILSELRPTIDLFFEQVIVNAEDPVVRRNRFALLEELYKSFWEVADISYLVVGQSG